MVFIGNFFNTNDEIKPLFPKPITFEVSHEEEKLVNRIDYTITDTYISISCDNFGDYEEVEENMYLEINEALKDPTIDALFVDRINDQVDFAKINLSNIKMLYIDSPEKEFNYKPFLNSTYTYISIKISNNTNLENMTDFLKNLKLENGLVSINFKDNVDVNLQNSYLESLSNLSGLDKLHISSNIIDKLNLTILQPNELVLCVDTTNQNVDYTIDINKKVKCLNLVPVYPEDYEETPVIDNLTIKSDNDELVIYTFIFKSWDDTFKAKLTKDTRINIPINSPLFLNGININEVTKEELTAFKNLYYVYISNPDDYQKYFEYNSNTMTLDEAIQNYHALLEKKSLKIQ